jgi:hypothetical protein
VAALTSPSRLSPLRCLCQGLGDRLS